MRLLSIFALVSALGVSGRMVIFNPKQGTTIKAGTNLDVQIWLPTEQGSWVPKYLIFGLRPPHDANSTIDYGLGSDIIDYAKSEIAFNPNMWFIDPTQPAGGFAAAGQNFSIPIPKMKDIWPPTEPGDVRSLVLGQFFTYGATKALYTAYAVQNYTIVE